MKFRIAILCLFISTFAVAAQKDWTLLLFLNGHNDLDSNTTVNINQMEKVGSNDQVNIVVQWASAAHPTTRRVYVQKDTDPSAVTSPIVQDLPRVDMGDYKALLEFYQWGIKNYPAKHYYLAVGDHGSGWRAINAPRFKDISEDDFSKNKITTEQQGYVLRQVAQSLGRRIDIFADDACLMGMIEVAGEFRNAVNLFIGSSSLIPATGWPYDRFLGKWVNHPDKSPERVAKAAVEEFTRFYVENPYDPDPYFIGAFRMQKLSFLEAALKSISDEVSQMEKSDVAALAEAAKTVQTYSSNDFLDLGHFLDRMEEEGLLESKNIRNASSALKSFTLLATGDPQLTHASGVGFWFPQSKSTFDKHATRYRGLASNQATDWADALELITTSREK